MILILACAFLVQDSVAEQAFKKIEETIEKARTLQVKYACDAQITLGGQEVKNRMWGALLLKEGDKMHFTLRAMREGREQELAVVCDGKGMRVGKEPEVRPIPPLLLGNHRRGLITAGVMGSMAFTKDLDGQDYRRTLIVSQVKSAPEGKEGASLTYSIQVAGTKAEVRARLWYDAKTYRLVRRTVDLKDGADSGTFTETYEDFAVDGEIPDERFSVKRDPKELVAATKAMIKQLIGQVELFKLNHDRFPDRLDDLVTRPKYVDPKDWPPGGYVTGVPLDGWGRAFIYRVPGTDRTAYDLVSLGEDGKEGGEGAAADLSNHIPR